MVKINLSKDLETRLSFWSKKQGLSAHAFAQHAIETKLSKMETELTIKAQQDNSSLRS
jgi:predicted DNA-binding protein